MDRETLKRVAWLARIDADETDLEAFSGHFDRLLDFVDVLKSAPIEGVEPMSHPLDAVQRLRDDEVTEADRRESLMSAAPETGDGLFLVPKVIE